MKLIFTQIILHYLENTDIVLFYPLTIIDGQSLKAPQRHRPGLLRDAFGYRHAIVYFGELGNV
jgi:hypothetical protein